MIFPHIVYPRRLFISPRVLVAVITMEEQTLKIHNIAVYVMTLATCRCWRRRSR